MAQLTDLIPLVRERCPGPLDQFMVDRIKRAYHQFCKGSGYLERVVVTTDGEALAADNGHYITSINGVVDMQENPLRKDVDYTNSKSCAFINVTSRFNQVSVTYSIVPSLPIADDINLDPVIFTRWSDCIAAGAASLLYKMPNQAWTDAMQSDTYDREFTDGCREAFRERINVNDQIQPTTKGAFF